MCLCIASKFQGDSVLKMSQYKNSVSATLKEQNLGVDLSGLEVFIMQTLSWNANFFTAIEVVQCYLNIEIKQKEDCEILEAHTTKILDFCITGTFKYLLRITIIDYNLCRYYPSVIAISSLLASTELMNRIEMRNKLIKKLYREYDDDYIV